MELKAGEILITREQIAERVAAIGAEISAKYKGQSLVVIGILRGAVIFMADVIRAIDPSVDVSLEFIRASSYASSTVSSGKVTLSQSTTVSVEGKHVLIVEDIIDTGLTLQRLCEYYRGQGALSVEICCLLNKKERRVVDVPVEYSGFIIPDEFVVGFGMDFDEKMRNLPDIHIARSV